MVRVWKTWNRRTLTTRGHDVREQKGIGAVFLMSVKSHRSILPRRVASFTHTRTHNCSFASAFPPLLPLIRLVNARKVYNENIRDLLNDTGEFLDLREDPIKVKWRECGPSKRGQSRSSQVRHALLLARMLRTPYRRG